MSQSAQFDAFYSESWPRLLVQTFAACGDLGLARESLRHAYVDAWHHWLRAEWQGPEDYVRSAAFTRAQWRGRARAFQRPQRVTRDQRATLKAMQALSPLSRKAIVLACLSDLQLAEIGAQVGETEKRTLELLDTGMAQLSAELGIPPQLVTARLQGLMGAARAAAQPTPLEIRHQGVRRRRVWLAGGVAAAIGLTVLAGAFVHAAPVAAEKVPPALGPEVTKALLMEPDNLAPLGSVARWSVLTTSDNTKGSGINTFCQASRFADPQGLRAFVRTFQLTGKVKRQATQTIELSRTERQSRSAYTRVLGWFSGCSKSQLQLLSTYDVKGVGDQATVLKLRSQGQKLSTYSVAVVRTGHIVTWAAFTTAGTRNPDTADLVTLVGNALAKACTSKAAGTCTNNPKITENPPPPSGDQAGMLVTADLPPIPGIDLPWLGTDAKASTTNPAATTCDNADFTAAGATKALARTFVIPGAQVPTRFGVSETLGEFSNLTQAKGLVAQVVPRMDGCQDSDPGAHITVSAQDKDPSRDTAYHLWRLESEISDKKQIVYWMGIARVGSNVAQVSFVPGEDGQDLDQAEFTALVVRARDRLFELSTIDGATAAPTPSAKASGKPSKSPSASPSGDSSDGADATP